MLIHSSVRLLLCVVACYWTVAFYSTGTARAFERQKEFNSSSFNNFIRDKNQQIIEVDLSGEEITSAEINDLLKLDGLRKISLRNTILKADMLQSIVTLQSLEALDLRGCELPVNGLSYLKSLPKLKRIRLSGKNAGMQLQDDDLGDLASIDSLRALYVDFFPIGDAGIKKLREHPNLQELGLAGTDVTDASLVDLASIAGLKKIRLANTEITGSGFSAIESHRSLKEIDLSGCKHLQQEYVSSLSKIPGMLKLNFYDSNISDAGVRDLKSASKLKWLNLDKTPITDKALGSVAELKNLEFLHVGSTQITDKGLNALTGLRKLKNLVATETFVTDEGVKEIQLKLPAASIKFGPKAS